MMGKLMSSEFTDIKIVSLDDVASGPSGDRALFRLVLKLSQRTPTAWSEYFNEAWGHHIYMMKRKATIFGDRLEIICMPDELEKDHLPELNKVMSETNDAYKKYASEQSCINQAEAERVQRQKEELSDLKRRLKFD
jgi:hypothetical protein